MAQLMTVVQLQHSTLLTLSRVACQTLTVEGVDLLQIKAAGEECCSLMADNPAGLLIPCDPPTALHEQLCFTGWALL